MGGRKGQLEGARGCWHICLAMHYIDRYATARCHWVALRICIHNSTDVEKIYYMAYVCVSVCIYRNIFEYSMLRWPNDTYLNFELVTNCIARYTALHTS